MKCPQCQSENKADSQYCSTCGKPLKVAPPPDEGIRGRHLSADKKYAHDKNPIKALLLSLIPVPGIGQFYNGDVMKGVVMLVGAFVFFVIPVLGQVDYIVIWIWAIVDAYKVAKENWSLWKW